MSIRAARDTITTVTVYDRNSGIGLAWTGEGPFATVTGRNKVRFTVDAEEARFLANALLDWITGQERATA